MSGAAIWALALEFPKRLVGNDYLRARHPELIAREGDRMLARIWSAPEGAQEDPWTEAMRPYLDDPFRGAQERRWMSAGETALSLELAAARQALEAAGVAPAEIDIALVSSFTPDTFAVGNAAPLAGALGLVGAAWNMESACSSALIGLHTAAAFVRSGQARRVLVVASCNYSRCVAETDSMAWSVGDGAVAFVVGDASRGAELLSFRILHTAPTCGAIRHEPDLTLPAQLRMSAGPNAGRLIRDAARWAISACCLTAAQDAGRPLDALDFYAVTTPVAWYARFFALAAGVHPDRVMNLHPRYANNGPALMPENLFHAAHEGRLSRGDLVLLHTVGSVSSAGAAVIRWGDVALGPPPPPGIPAEP